MHFTSLLALAASAQAYITSLSLQDSNATPGSNLTLLFNTSTYIQNWEDFSAIMGATQASTSPQSLGQIVVGSLDFVSMGQQNTGTGQFSTPLFINSSMFQPGQQYTLTAAITSVTGASLMTSVRFLNTTFST